jgi:hypothetical protein
MPGFLLHVGATVVCSHGGQATPVSFDPKATVGLQPVVTLSSNYAIAGCTLSPPPTANGPCATAVFTSAATRITVAGRPVLLRDSLSTCAPTATPLQVTQVQTKVSGI